MNHLGKQYSLQMYINADKWKSAQGYIFNVSKDVYLHVYTSNTPALKIYTLGHAFICIKKCLWRYTCQCYNRLHSHEIICFIIFNLRITSAIIHLYRDCQVNTWNLTQKCISKRKRWMPKLMLGKIYFFHLNLK